MDLGAYNAESSSYVIAYLQSIYNRFITFAYP